VNTQSTLADRGILLRLENMELDDGWIVEELIPKQKDQTGGCFSEGYRCKHKTGREGHLKAIDLHEALRQPDLLAALTQLADGARCEQELLDKCRRMDRIVTMLSYGTIRTVNDAPLVIPIPYVIFERANGSIQGIVQSGVRPSHEWIFRTLHHVATGLMQLHTAGIAHQDLKQSNILDFSNDQGVKIADLGRAVDRARTVWYDAHAWPGATAYAPPEVAYGFQQSEFNTRRFATDMFLLGSLATALFVGVPFNVLLYQELPQQFRPPMFSGTYVGTFESVEAYLHDAFDKVIEKIASCIPTTAPYREQIVAFMRQWCNPDPRKRGHPTTRDERADGGNIYYLERYVSALPNLARRAATYSRQLTAI
jgi:eukaryotic-like serine/threonine-protein kinase